MTTVRFIDGSEKDVTPRSISTGAMRMYAEQLQQGTLQVDPAVLFATNLEMRMPKGMIRESTELAQDDIDRMLPESFLRLAQEVEKVNEFFFCRLESQLQTEQTEQTDDAAVNS